MKPPVSISLAQTKDKSPWDCYVIQHPQGIAYQLYAFKAAVQKAYGFKGVYFLAHVKNRIVGILPLVHVHLPGLSGSLVSLPYCDAGGMLADSVDIEKQLLEHALAFSKNSGINRVCIRSIKGFANIDPCLTINPNKARMVLPLPKSAEELLSSLKAKVRSQVKKPQRDGLFCEIGGKKLLPDFYKVFCENMRDLGSPVHSFDWLQHILIAYQNRAHVGIVRMPDKKAVAAGIILCHPKVVSIPWASSLRRFNRLNPNMLLYWNFLNFAIAHGYREFDFGRSTPEEGTFKFKKQWGAIPKFLHWGYFSGSNQQNHDLLPLANAHSSQTPRLRYQAELALTKIPVPLLTFLGTHTRKYISL